MNPNNYIENREISWLKFNERVLEEAVSEDNPLLERLKFLAIFTSNLDEFFMVRVGTMNDYIKYVPDYVDGKTGMNAREQLEKIYEISNRLYQKRDKVFENLMKLLEKENLKKEKIKDLSKKELSYLEKYFFNNIFPMLSPLIIDTWHPFPFIPNKQLNVIVYLSNKKKEVLGMIPVPSNMERVIMIDKELGRYVLLEEVILHFVKNIFSMYELKESSIMSVTRNMDIETDVENYDENLDYRQYMKQIVKTRNKLEPLRMEIQSRISEKFLDALLQRLNLSEEQVFTFNCPINLSYLFNISSFLPPNITTKLSYSAFSPVVHPIADKKHSMIDFIEKKDLLLFYPFESMKPFLNLIKEASEREDVQSIKITLYRISKDSKLAEYLINAVENGKDVTVLMELRARFDETNNIEWAQKLEEAGCHIIYGTDGFKVHSKICMITYRKDGEIKHITQVGTGNYNEKTSKMYTDYSLMTSDIEIGRDADIFFKNMSLGNLMGVYKKLWVAPSSFKENILKNINNEIEKAKRGEEGKIVIKCNSFTDKDLILALADASDLGVKITLIVRGICCLVPQIEGKTRNIKVISVVGRFLEHSRIYSFGIGEEQILYIASGDMMTRNTEHRVEVGCPVLDNDIKERINSQINTILEDNQKARILEPNGEYKTVSSSESERKINSQEEFIRDAEKNIYKILEDEVKISEKIQPVKKGFFKKLFHIS